MVDVEGEWKWELIQSRVPDHILLRLAATQRPMPSFPVDSIGWKLRNDGRNKWVFIKQSEVWGSIITHSKWLAKTTVTAAAEARKLPVSTSTPAVWNPPTEGWLKLNANGTRSSIDGRALCEAQLLLVASGLLKLLLQQQRHESCLFRLLRLLFGTHQQRVG
ncbi:hypothetical protein V6N13_127125 [Hibiscus sabdariffa]